MLIKLRKSKENMCNFVRNEYKNQKHMKQICLTLTFLLGLCCGVMAQPSIKKIQLHLVPDHADALYKSGEQVKMKVVALHSVLTPRLCLVKPFLTLHLRFSTSRSLHA